MAKTEETAVKLNLQIVIDDKDIKPKASNVKKSIEELRKAIESGNKDIKLFDNSVIDKQIKELQAKVSSIDTSPKPSKKLLAANEQYKEAIKLLKELQKQIKGVSSSSSVLASFHSMFKKNDMKVELPAGDIKAREKEIARLSKRLNTLNSDMQAATLENMKAFKGKGSGEEVSVLQGVIDGLDKDIANVKSRIKTLKGEIQEIKKLKYSKYLTNLNEKIDNSLSAFGSRGNVSKSFAFAFKDFANTEGDISALTSSLDKLDKSVAKILDHREKLAISGGNVSNLQPLISKLKQENTLVIDLITNWDRLSESVKQHARRVLSSLGTGKVKGIKSSSEAVMVDAGLKKLLSMDYDKPLDEVTKKVSKLDSEVKVAESDTKKLGTALDGVAKTSFEKIAANIAKYDDKVMKVIQLMDKLSKAGVDVGGKNLTFFADSDKLARDALVKRVRDFRDGISDSNIKGLLTDYINSIQGVSGEAASAAKSLNKMKQALLESLSPKISMEDKIAGVKKLQELAKAARDAYNSAMGLSIEKSHVYSDVDRLIKNIQDRQKNSKPSKEKDAMYENALKQLKEYKEISDNLFGREKKEKVDTSEAVKKEQELKAKAEETAKIVEKPVKVNVDTKEATEKLDNLKKKKDEVEQPSKQKKTSKTKQEEPQPKVEVNTDSVKQAEKEVANLKAEASKSTPLEIKVDANTAPAEKKINDLTNEINNLTKEPKVVEIKPLPSVDLSYSTSHADYKHNYQKLKDRYVEQVANAAAKEEAEIRKQLAAVRPPVDFSYSESHANFKHTYKAQLDELLAKEEAEIRQKLKELSSKAEVPKVSQNIGDASKLYDTFKKPLVIDTNADRFYDQWTHIIHNYEWLRTEKLVKQPLVIYVSKSTENMLLGLTRLIDRLTKPKKLDLDTSDIKKQITDFKTNFSTYLKDKPLKVGIQVEDPHQHIIDNINRLQKELDFKGGLNKLSDVKYLDKFYDKAWDTAYKKDVDPSKYTERFDKFIALAKEYQKLKDAYNKPLEGVKSAFSEPIKIKVIPEVKQEDIDKSLNGLKRDLSIVPKLDSEGLVRYSNDLNMFISTRKLHVLPLLDMKEFDTQLWPTNFGTPRKFTVRPELQQEGKKVIDDWISGIKNIQSNININIPNVDHIATGAANIQVLNERLNALHNLVTGEGNNKNNRQFRIDNTQALDRIGKVRTALFDLMNFAHMNSDQYINLHINMPTVQLNNQITNAATNIRNNLNLDKPFSELRNYLTTLGVALRDLENHTKFRFEGDFKQITTAIKGLRTGPNIFHVTPTLAPRSLSEIVKQVRDYFANLRNPLTLEVTAILNKGSQTRIVTEITNIVKAINNIPKDNYIDFRTNAGQIIQALDNLNQTITATVNATNANININMSYQDAVNAEKVLAQIVAHINAIRQAGSINIKGLNNQSSSGGGNPLGGGGSNNNSNSPLGGGNVNLQWETYKQKVAKAILEADKAHQLWKGGLGTEQDYKQAHEAFKQALKDYLDFSRQMGTMSYSSQASQLEKLAGSAQKGSKELMELVNEIMKLKHAQEELNKLTSIKPVNYSGVLSAKDFAQSNRKFSNSTNNGVMTLSGMPGFFGNRVENAAYVTRFLGRASKGIGSAFEAISQFMVDTQRVVGISQQRANELRDKVKATDAAMRDLDNRIWNLRGNDPKVAAKRTELLGKYNQLSSLRQQALNEIDARESVASRYEYLGNVISTIGMVGGALGLLEKSVEWPVRMLQYFGNILQNVADRIYSLLSSGIKLYEQQESAIFSFTASIVSSAKVNGQALKTTPNGQAITMGISKDLIDRATLDAEMSAFSLEELLRSLQGTLPLLMRLGLSLEQSYQINKGVAGMAKMLQLTPSQILQETRDIAQGSITSRGSQIANALGITNADINKYKGDAEGLFAFLMDKFSEYNALLSQFEDTAIGRWQQLQERWQTATKTIVDGVADDFKGLFEYLINQTGRYVDKEGNVLNALTGKWEDRQGNSFNEETRQFEDSNGNAVSNYSKEYLDNVGKAYKFQLSQPLQAAADVLKDMVLFTASIVDNFIEFLKKITGADNALAAVENILRAIEVLTLTLAKFTVSWVLTIYKATDFLEGFYLSLSKAVAMAYKLKNVFAAIAEIIAIGLLGGLIGPVAGAMSKVLGIARGIGPAVAGAISSRFPSLAREVGTLGRSAVNLGGKAVANKGTLGKAALAGGIGYGLYSLDIEDDPDAVIEAIERVQAEREYKFGQNKWFENLNTVVSGGIKEAMLNAEKSETEKREKQGENQLHIDPNDIKGIAKAVDDSKALKKYIQEQQKILKAAIDGLKAVLDDSLANLKEIREKNELDFKQGLKPMSDYYAEKAALDKAEAEQRLQELEIQKELLNQTPFANPYDATKEAFALEKEIREQERVLGKASKAQNDVAKIFGKVSTVESNVESKMRETADYFTDVARVSNELEKKEEELLEKQRAAFSDIEGSMSSAESAATHIDEAFANIANNVSTLLNESRNARSVSGSSSGSSGGVADASKYPDIVGNGDVSFYIPDETIEDILTATVHSGSDLTRKDIITIANILGINNAVKYFDTILGLIQQESHGDQSLVSGAGAVGTMQIMPDTFDSIVENNPSYFSGRTPSIYNKADNIIAGILYYLQRVQDFNWNEKLALAAYNAGPGAVQRYGGVPYFPETQNYVGNVLGNAKRNYDLNYLQYSDEEANQRIQDFRNGLDVNAKRVDENTSAVVDNTKVTDSGAKAYQTAQKDSSESSDDLIKALNGLITSEFGMRDHPIYGDRREHHGVDIGADYGTKIPSTADGKVTYAGWMQGYGNTVMVLGEDGLTRLYGHMQNIADGIAEGVEVSVKDVLGYVGSTGNSTGPHVHYEIRDANDNPIAPYDYLGFGNSSSSKGSVDSPKAYYTKSAFERTKSAFEIKQEVNTRVLNGIMDDFGGDIKGIFKYLSSEMYARLVNDPLESIDGLDIKQKLQDDIISYLETELSLAGDMVDTSELRRTIARVKNDKEKILAKQSAFSAAKLAQLVQKQQKELLDADYAAHEKYFDYVSKATETWFTYALNESLLGSMTDNNDPTEVLRRYSKYYYNDEKNPLSPAYIISKMWEDAKKYQLRGDINKAQEIRQKILSFYESFTKRFEEYLNKLEDYFSKYKTWLDNTWTTNLQKERGTREIQAREGQMEYRLYDSLVNDEGTGTIDLQLKSVQERISQALSVQFAALSRNDEDNQIVDGLKDVAKTIVDKYNIKEYDELGNPIINGYTISTDKKIKPEEAWTDAGYTKQREILQEYDRIMTQAAKIPDIIKEYSIQDEDFDAFGNLKRVLEVIPESLKNTNNTDQQLAMSNQREQLNLLDKVNKEAKNIPDIIKTLGLKFDDLGNVIDETIPEFLKIKETDTNEVKDLKHGMQISSISSAKAISYSVEDLNMLNQQEKMLKYQQESARINKLLAKQLSQINDYLLRTQQVSKQALEDGLVTFLTDGVNEAESLGDALRDLAVNYLKTMQKYFAQEMVTDMMTKWFPVRREEYGQGITGNLDEFAMRSFYERKFGTSNLSDQFVPIVDVKTDDIDNLAKSYYYNKYGENVIEKEKLSKMSQEERDRYTTTVGKMELSNDAKMSDALLDSKAKQTISDVIPDLLGQIRDNTAEADKADEDKIDSDNDLGAEHRQEEEIAAINANTASNNASAEADAVSAEATQSLEATTQVGTQIDAQGNVIDQQGNVIDQQGNVIGQQANVEERDNTLALRENTQKTDLGKIGANASVSGSASGGSGGSVAIGSSHTYYNPIADLWANPVLQVGSSAFALKTLFSGDTKEKLLSMIYLELQLIWSELVFIANNTALLGGLFSKGGMVHAAHGWDGNVHGPGTSTSDSIPAMLSNGEYVINAASTRKYHPLIEAINNDSLGKFARGGIVRLANGGYANQIEVGKAADSDTQLVLDALSNIANLLTSIYEAVSLKNWNPDEDNDGEADEIVTNTSYSSYMNEYDSRSKFGHGLQHITDNLGFSVDSDTPRLVNNLPEDTALHYKMMVDLLQTIADNTYTIINYLAVSFALQFLQLAGQIVDLVHMFHELNVIVTLLELLLNELWVTAETNIMIANNTAPKDVGSFFHTGGIVHAAKGYTFANRYNGLVEGPGTSTSDSIPAMLSNGEAVLNAKAVRKLGTNFIDSVNRGDFAKIKATIPHFADGGILGNAQQSTARGMTGFAQNIGTNVSTTNNMNIALVRNEQEAMEHFMRSPNGQRILCDFQRGNGRVFSRFNS